jgi:hypothetical protein
VAIAGSVLRRTLSARALQRVSRNKEARGRGETAGSTTWHPLGDGGGTAPRVKLENTFPAHFARTETGFFSFRKI